MQNKTKVDVNLDELMDGQGMILTLADQYILDGDNINEDEDVLENADIKAKDKIEFRRKIEEKIRKKNHTQKYQEAEDGQKRGILEHYDEDKMTKEGFYIDANGKMVEDQNKLLQQISNKLKKESTNQQSLLFEDRVASDYKPNIPSTFIKKRINKQQINDPVKPIIDKPADQIELEEDDYEQLQRSIQNKVRSKLNSKNDEKLKELVEQNKLCEETIPQYSEVFIKPTPRINNPEMQEIREISQATDFLSGVKTEQEIIEIKQRISTKTIRDTGTTSVVNVSLPTERIRNQRKHKQQIPDEPIIESEGQNKIKQVDDEDVIDDKVEPPIDMGDLQDILEEENHDVGLAATLKILRDRGELSDKTYNFVGRYKDQKQYSDANLNENEIQLDYRDSSGRLMTPKEAFRYQCWIFHNEAPSKNKMEKKKKRDHQILKQRQLESGETPLMKAFKEEQKKNQTGYMVISKKKHLE